MSAQEVTCVICPVGCRITVTKDPSEELGYKVDNNECKRGIPYSIEEVTDPRRNLATTVIVEGALLPRIPVRTSKPLPKNRIMDSMKEINKVKLQAPVKINQVVIADILGTGTDILTSRSMDKV